MNLQTFKLWLEPDMEIPRFQCLRWNPAEVSVNDVLLKGIHPWLGQDKHHSLPEEFTRRMNKDAFRIPALIPFGYCDEFDAAFGPRNGKYMGFEQMLEAVSARIRFVDDLEYLELLEIARSRLANNWTNRTVMKMITYCLHGFHEVRQLLKRKDCTVKIMSREDLESLDLPRILSVEDFAGKDAAIIAHGIPAYNSRKAGFLKEVTDDEGRLRLVPEMRKMSVTFSIPGLHHRPLNGFGLTYHATRNGNTLFFKPDLGYNARKREMALTIAARWRTDHGRLCFQTTMDRLNEMLDHEPVRVDFYGPNYAGENRGDTANATVAPSYVDMYYVGRCPTKNLKADQLKAILHAHGVPTSGLKTDLLDKVIQLAASEYRKHLPELDKFFTRNRFIRVRREAHHHAHEFRVLEKLGSLQNMLITMYVMKHLRGNAVLEATHVNETYSDEELACALLNRDLTLSGSFMRVV